MADSQRGEATIDEQLSIDEALEELRTISTELDRLPDGDARRASLLARRDRLRDAARHAADDTRDPAVLEWELDHLRRRLSELDGERIQKAWPEKGNYRWINDPSAYSRGINREIDDKTQEERAFLESRITQLEASLAEANERRRSNG